MTTNRRRLAWAIIGASIAGVLVLVLVSVVTAAVMATTIRKSQVTNTETIDNTAQTLDILLDCTTPEGDCYRRGQQSTADAVDNIGLLSTYAAACADQPDQQTAAEIRECVLDLLKHPKR